MSDILIKNGRIVDGTGNPWYKGDLAIEEGRISRIGRSLDSKSGKVIDAKDLYISPGFIDIHSHSDFTLLANSKAESKVRQGVTTEVNGQCGFSSAPLNGEAKDWAKEVLKDFDQSLNWSSFGEYRAYLEKQGIAINTANFVGNSTIRLSAMGYAKRRPSSEEMSAMGEMMEQSMAEGAFGLSSGLDKGFTPGSYADTQELIALCQSAAKYGGLYASHIRNRQERVVEAVKEAIEIGKAARVPVQISHLVVRRPFEGKGHELIDIISQARNRGIDVTYDVVIPVAHDGFHWAMGQLRAQVLPMWAYEEGVDKVLEWLKDSQMRKRFREEVEPQWGIWSRGEWENLKLLHANQSSELIGKTFKEICECKEIDPWEAAYDILLAEGAGFREVCILGPSTAEEESILMFKHPVAAFESDRRALAPYGVLGKRTAEPNSYGAFPRVIRRYVREKGILTLEEAVQKMSSLAAHRMGLWDRGILRQGAWADLVIFDLDRIQDEATLEDPAKYASGIEYVLVNGEVVVEGGEHTGNLPGKVLTP